MQVATENNRVLFMQYIYTHTHWNCWKFPLKFLSIYLDYILWLEDFNNLNKLILIGVIIMSLLDFNKSYYKIFTNWCGNENLLGISQAVLQEFGFSHKGWNLHVGPPWSCWGKNPSPLNVYVWIKIYNYQAIAILWKQKKKNSASAT